MIRILMSKQHGIIKKRHRIMPNMSKYACDYEIQIFICNNYCEMFSMYKAVYLKSCIFKAYIYSCRFVYLGQVTINSPIIFLSFIYPMVNLILIPRNVLLKLIPFLCLYITYLFIKIVHLKSAF